jgi:hypothetical protein
MYFYHYYTPEKRNQSFPSQQQLNLIAFYSTSREKKKDEKNFPLSPLETLSFVVETLLSRVAGRVELERAG